ncbi:MAG: hypothetical protein HUJ26_04570 [Planctomycetaceae bacterium]|nr:hypothetical protein [Planctomycetaceae bacterium]
MSNQENFAIDLFEPEKHTRENEENSMKPSELQVQVGPREGRRRLVIVTRGAEEVHRDMINSDEATQRQRLLNTVAQKTEEPAEVLDEIERELISQADDADAFMASTAPASGDNTSQADLIVQLSQEMELFCNQDGVGYVSIHRDGHAESHQIGSQQFERYLRTQFQRRHGRIATAASLRDAVLQIDALASEQGEQLAVHLRQAVENDSVYIDLANDKWEVVEINREGWKLLENCPVKFRRTRGMRHLPTPSPGARLSDLANFMNVPPEDRVLLYGWLISAIAGTGAIPPLILIGEQGTAKSTATRQIRSLIDPHQSILRSAPKTERDLSIAAENNAVLTYDNLSHIPPELSDALCRLATGGGFATRKLYTDDEEQIFDARRPIILNSIDDIANRSDLLDRSVVLTLEQIPESKRRAESEFWAEFDQARSKLQGAIYDAISQALRRIDEVELEDLPRMADFAKLAVAAEPAMGVSQGAFLRQYQENRRRIAQMALDASPIPSAVRSLLEADRRRRWSGTATDLLSALRLRASGTTGDRSAWPRTPRGISSTLRRLAPNLRKVGIVVDFDRTASERTITIVEAEHENFTSPSIMRRQPRSRERRREVNESIADHVETTSSQ